MDKKIKAQRLSNIVKFTLILILLGCLFKMPFGYYKFIRVAAFIGFLFIAYNEREKENYLKLMGAVILAILFNPIYKIHFTREIWNNIDLTVAGLLGIWLFVELLIKSFFLKGVNKND